MKHAKEKQTLQANFKEKMDYDEIMNCTRCGFCLPSCPTYIETGNNEVHSPRGRIALMKGLVDGDVDPDDEDVKRSIDMCLGCRACEPVCPSGVKFGHLLEQARDVIYQNKKKTVPEKIIRSLILKQLFPYQNRMIGAVSLLGFSQRLGIPRLARATGIMHLFPETIGLMEKILPVLPKKKQLKRRQRHFVPLQEKKKNVAFFSGCLMDTIFMSTNDATTKLLQYAGCEIVVPETQGCCGALQGHSGERDQAKEMAKKNIEAFEMAEVDYIITNAGGCGSFLEDYGSLLKDDQAWKIRAKEFSKKIKDITSVLVELGFDKFPLQLDEHIVTYQDSCHLKNGQKTFMEPRLLLESIGGIEYKEMIDAGRCCGSAGIYNLVEPEMSMRILDYKMDQAKQTKATIIVTTNPGCLLQMKLGIEREGLSDQMEAVHIVDILLKAYEKASEYQNNKT